MVCSSGSSAAMRSCSTYFSKAVALLFIISLRSLVADIVSLTGCSVMSIGVSLDPASCALVLVRNACAKRALITVASDSENKVLAKSFTFFIALAVGAKYFSSRYGGKYIRLLKKPIEALSSSAKLIRISSKGRHDSAMLLGLFNC